MGITYFKKKQFLQLLCHILLIGGALFMVFPLFWMVSTALKPDPENYSYPPYWIPREPTLSNFPNALKSAFFGRYFLNSIVVSSTVTLTTVFFGSFSGYVFAKFSFPGRQFLFYLVIGKLMVPAPILIVPLYLLVARLRLVDTLYALIIPLLMGAFGIFMMRQFISSVPNELIDAARIDGCSDFGIYWRIVLPSIVPALATLSVITFMSLWNDFLWPLIVINSPERMTLPLGIAKFSNEFYTEYGLMMAAVLVVVLPPILVFFFLQRQIIESIVMTGMKE